MNPIISSASAMLADFDGHMDLDDGWGVLMALGMIAFWGVVIFGLIWLVRELAHSRRPPQPSDPLAILDRRLAEGALTPEEYRERRSVLTGESDEGS